MPRWWRRPPATSPRVAPGFDAQAFTAAATAGLIFLPGFSTSDTVSSISGRGVGMDVVRNNVERIGGTVDVQSTLGVGTTIKMRIPLTLAIIRALLVESTGQRYAIPQASMIELIRLERDKARTSIERIHGVSVYRFRGKLLPLMYLNRVLGRECDAAAESVVGSNRPVPASVSRTHSFRAVCGSVIKRKYH